MTFELHLTPHKEQLCYRNSRKQNYIVEQAGNNPKTLSIILALFNQEGNFLIKGRPTVYKIQK